MKPSKLKPSPIRRGYDALSSKLADGKPLVDGEVKQIRQGLRCVQMYSYNNGGTKDIDATSAAEAAMHAATS